MKVSLDWLNDYVELERSPQDIAEILSNLGFACEAIEHTGNDTVLDIEVTSNRGDCLGHIGIARELAAATSKQLKLPAVELNESQRDAREFVSVEIAQPNLCGRYTARIIEDVRVGPSPDWMVRRLEAVGIRSVNNVVDATNYAMMETGQPPHAFDYDRLKQGKIIVRQAVAGEQMVSIDGTRCRLDPDMLVIADAAGPVAIAGVMGGLHTEVNDHTRTVLLEDAYFDPVTVRTTARKLGLASEAAFRFERIVDIDAVDWASMRTAQLIVMAAGGRVARGVVDAYPLKKEKKQVLLRLARLNKLIGIEFSTEQVLKILSALKFEPQLRDGSVVCTVPSWRSDVYREVDLIEEVARLHGYEKVPVREKIEIQVAPPDRRQRLLQAVGRYLNGCGFYETITTGFVDKTVADLFAEPGKTKHLAVRHTSRRSENILRRSLIGSLLAVLKTNVNVKNLPCRIFEIAQTFAPDDTGPLPIEKTKLALVCDGDLRLLCGAVEGLLKDIDRDASVEFTPTNLVWADAGAAIVVNGRPIGVAGLVSHEVGRAFDFDEISPVAAEMDFEDLLAIEKGPVRVKPVPRFPAIERDLSVVVDESVRWADIVAALRKKAPAELEDIRFVDIYRGKGIPPGRKSVTISLRFRDEDGTLTHETVDAFQQELVTALAENVRAQLRSL